MVISFAHASVLVVYHDIVVIFLTALLLNEFTSIIFWLKFDEIHANYESDILHLKIILYNEKLSRTIEIWMQTTKWVTVSANLLVYNTPKSYKEWKTMWSLHLVLVTLYVQLNIYN